MHNMTKTIFHKRLWFYFILHIKLK